MVGTQTIPRLRECRRCGSHGRMVSFAGDHRVFAALRSKCERYKRNHPGTQCKTEIHKSALAAANEWNSDFAVSLYEALRMKQSEAV